MGLLMLVVMLRWRGWDVKYLGADLSLERLEEALGPLRPTLLMFSANRPETAAELARLPAVLAGFPDPKPLVVVGGQAFTAFPPARKHGGDVHPGHAVRGRHCHRETDERTSPGTAAASQGRLNAAECLPALHRE